MGELQWRPVMSTRSGLLFKNTPHTHTHTYPQTHTYTPHTHTQIHTTRTRAHTQSEWTMRALHSVHFLLETGLGIPPGGRDSSADRGTVHGQEDSC